MDLYDVLEKMAEKVSWSGYDELAAVKQVINESRPGYVAPVEEAVVDPTTSDSSGTEAATTSSDSETSESAAESGPTVEGLA